jgi:hypothetical protein
MARNTDVSHVQLPHAQQLFANIQLSLVEIHQVYSSDFTPNAKALQYRPFLLNNSELVFGIDTQWEWNIQESEAIIRDLLQNHCKYTRFELTRTEINHSESGPRIYAFFHKNPALSESEILNDDMLDFSSRMLEALTQYTSAYPSQAQTVQPYVAQLSPQTMEARQFYAMHCSILFPIILQHLSQNLVKVRLAFADPVHCQVGIHILKTLMLITQSYAGLEYFQWSLLNEALQTEYASNNTFAQLTTVLSLEGNDPMTLENFSRLLVHPNTINAVADGAEFTCRFISKTQIPQQASAPMPPATSTAMLMAASGTFAQQQLCTQPTAGTSINTHNFG